MAGVSPQICGLDEAGRGPLAGPVMAACVYIPESVRRKNFWDEVSDSKILTAKRRNDLYEKIRETCIFSVADSCVEEIDRINILQASLAAMKRAYDVCCDLMPEDHTAYIDGNQMPPGLPCPSLTVIDGDLLHKEIGAASILAKVSRDRYMQSLHEEFPVYGWQTNFGYSTREHLRALEDHGVCPHHRRSFGPVRVALQTSRAA